MIFPHGCVSEFHDAIGVDNRLEHETAWPRLREEIVEFKSALDAKDRAGIAREAADIIYVLYGIALTMPSGPIHLDHAFNEVHLSNMRKVGPDGTVATDPETGKILKPKDWYPPNMSRAIRIDMGPATGPAPRGTERR